MNGNVSTRGSSPQPTRTLAASEPSRAANAGGARFAGRSSGKFAWFALRSQQISRRDARKAIARLAALTTAGVAIGDAIASSARRGDPLLVRLHAATQRGVSLSLAMQGRGLPFSEAEVAVVRAGERGGSTPRALALLCQRMERESAGRRRVSSALAYPAILITGGVAALCFLSIVVLPSFTSLYEGSQVELPALTRTLLSFGVWVRVWGALALLVAVATAAAIGLARRSVPAVAWWFDHAAVDLAPMRSFSAPRACEETCSLLALLLGAGCEVEEALTLSARAAANRVVGARIADALRSLRHGVALSRAWTGARLDWSGDASALLEIAEATGGYAEAFSRVATLEGAAAEQTLAAACRFSEPVAVIAMAVAVGGGVLAVYQPMLGSASLLLGGNG